MANFRDAGRVAITETSEDWKKLDTVYYVLPAGDLLPLPAKYILDGCRRVDPGYIVMAVRNVYRNPHGRILYFDRYVTALGDDGTRMDAPHRDFLRYQIRYPIGYQGMRPHEILDIWEGDETVKGLPGKFVPFTWAQVIDVQFFSKRMEGIRAEVSNDGGKTINYEKLQRMIVGAKQESRDKAMNSLKAEVDYRFDHDDKHIRKLVEQTSHSDLKEAGLVA